LKDQLGYQDVVVEYLMDQQALTGDEALTALSKQGMNWPTQHLYVRLVRTSSLGRDALRNLTEGVLRRELTTITEPLLRDLEYEEEAISQIVRDSFILHTSFFDLEEVFSIAQLRCSPADMEKVVNSENYGTLMQKLAEAAVRSAAAPSGVRDRAEVRRAEQEPPRTAAEVQAISSGDSSDEHVHFTVYHPQSVGGKSKSRLLAYAHIAEATSRIQAHAGALLKNLSEAFEKRGGIATLDIQRGASITVAPYLPGCRFEPRILTFGWLEDWHCASFVVGMESTVSPGNVSGSVDFYVGPLLVASVPITVYCGSPPSASSAVSVPVTTTPYESIFVSYSHRDAKVVNGLQQAYKVLGIKYLRDIDQLRSGEEWSEALIGFIEKAAIFQLCWSRSAMGSAYVEREWRYAWSLSRRFFIRPVYWERPMPSPPAELSNLHFAYLSLQNDAPWWKRFRRSL